MDRKLATKDKPLLNQGLPYIPDAGRTEEDDVASTYEVASSIMGRTHMSRQEFNMVYRSTMRFFTEQEKYSFKQYQMGEKKPEEFYRDCGNYLKTKFPDLLGDGIDGAEHDFNVLMNRINIAIFKYDVIQPLIDNPETSDIKICSPWDIRVRVKGKAYKSDTTFFDESDLIRFVEGLSYRNRVDIYNNTVITFTDSHDPNYILRFTVSSPHVNAVEYPYLHIRKVPKTKPDFDELIKRKMLNNDVKLYLIDRAKASKGIVFAGPPGCVDKDTEFFNGKEWKSIAEWDNEKVLQYDVETGKASLVMPEYYIKKPCEYMYHFKSERGIDQILSPEHRVLYYKRSSKGKKIPKVITAEEMYNKLMDNTFEGQIKTSFDYSGQGIDLSDEEIKVMCAVICDGTFDNRKEEYNKCTLNLKKQRKIEEAEKILNEAKIEYTKHEYSNGYARFRFTAPRKEKEFGDFWYNCNNHQLQIICENVIKWDGNTNKKTNHISFSSNNKKNADFVQFAYSSCGYRANLFEKDRTGKKYKNGYKRKSKEYIVSVSKYNYVGISKKDNDKTVKLSIEKVKPQDGYKYCFTVPKDTLVLRRNGKIFITKNSGKTTALNAFIEYIPKTRETLVIQENDELQTQQSGFMFKHVSHGFHGEPICTLEDLGKMALVEGCNEFIIGEVKGGEMRYAMTLLNAGGHAALTVHSTNAYETLDKLADLVKYGSSYTFDEARRMLKTFDTVVYMEGYRIREILEVEGYDDETKQYKYVNIYRYDGEFDD